MYNDSEQTSQEALKKKNLRKFCLQIKFLTCNVPLLRCMTIARSVRNHFFINTPPGVTGAGPQLIVCSRLLGSTLAPQMRCSSMYWLKQISSVTFFFSSAGTSSLVKPITRLLRSLYCRDLHGHNVHSVSMLIPLLCFLRFDNNFQHIKS